MIMSRPLMITFNSLYGIRGNLLNSSISFKVLSIPFMGYKLFKIKKHFNAGINLSIPFMGYLLKREKEKSYTKTFNSLYGIIVNSLRCNKHFFTFNSLYGIPRK